MHRCRIARLAPLWLIVTAVTASPAVAQVDLTGHWATLPHEDQPERGPGSELGDYTGIPLNAAGRMRADTWDASSYELPEWQCRPHSADYMWRSRPPVHIWKTVDAVTGDTIAYHATFQDILTRAIWMDGRPHPPAEAAHTWAGFSSGEWSGDVLTIRTTHLKEYMIRRNGVPLSDRRTITEHWIRHGNILTIVNITNDPIYMAEPFIQTTDFTLDIRGQDTPELCEIEEETDRKKSSVPHRLPGEPSGSEEFARKLGLPLAGVRGGASTIYPEFVRAEHATTAGRSAGAAGSGGAGTGDDPHAEGARQRPHDLRSGRKRDRPDLPAGRPRRGYRAARAKRRAARRNPADLRQADRAHHQYGQRSRSHGR